MKKVICFLFLTSFCGSLHSQLSECPILPSPVVYKKTEGALYLPNQISIQQLPEGHKGYLSPTSRRQLDLLLNTFHNLSTVDTLGRPFIRFQKLKNVPKDFYSIAATSILKKKLLFLGAIVGKYYQFLERRQMQRSDHIIHITEKFCNQTDKWNIDRSKISVIPNWGALNEIKVTSKLNSWSKKNNLDETKDRVIYSGTMALKHNPALIEELAKNNSDIEILVIGSGVGIEYLKKISSHQSNIKILPLQPFTEFDMVLGSGDVLIAVIEEDAGKFSVPSKILSYMCAGKPIVLAAPSENLASQIISQSHSGVVVDSIDKEGFSKAVYELITDKIRSDTMGRNARKYAEKNFNIKTITDSFESIFQSIVN